MSAAARRPRRRGGWVRGPAGAPPGATVRRRIYIVRPTENSKCLGWRRAAPVLASSHVQRRAPRRHRLRALPRQPPAVPRPPRRRQRAAADRALGARAVARRGGRSAAAGDRGRAMSVRLSPRPAAAPRSAERLPGALREWEAVAWVPKGLLIGDGFREAAEGRTLEVEDPSTGAGLCSVADAGEADALEALDAAADAQAAWA